MLKTCFVWRWAQKATMIIICVVNIFRSCLKFCFEFSRFDLFLQQAKIADTAYHLVHTPLFSLACSEKMFKSNSKTNCEKLIRTVHHFLSCVHVLIDFHTGLNGFKRNKMNSSIIYHGILCYRIEPTLRLNLWKHKQMNEHDIPWKIFLGFLRLKSFNTLSKSMKLQRPKIIYSSINDF